MRKKRGTDRGYTLIEAVVAFALAAILFASLISVVAPAYRMYQRTRANADAQLIAGNILDTIRTTAVAAAVLNAEGSEVHVGRNNTFFVNNGRLWYNDDAVYDPDYYNGKSIALSCENVGENIIRVTVTVSDGDEMLPARATAIIAPLWGILNEQGDTSVDAALDDARQVIADNPGSSASTLFNRLYGAEGGNNSFEQKSVFDIIPRARLQALRDEAVQIGPAAAAEAAFFNELLDPNKTFYMAIYFTNYTLVPIAYLTDVEIAQQNDAGNPVYFVYWNRNWYMRNPKLLQDADAMPEFDNLAQTNIVNYLNKGDYFILAANVKLPLPDAPAVP